MGNTLLEITTALQDPTTSVYLYIGNETDNCWSVAKVACGFAANAKPLRADNFSVVQSLLTEGNFAAVAFNWDGEPKAYLDGTEAADLNTVLAKIAEAQAL